jgi:hypothetical protein
MTVPFGLFLYSYRTTAQNSIAFLYFPVSEANIFPSINQVSNIQHYHPCVAFGYAGFAFLIFFF